MSRAADRLAAQQARTAGTLAALLASLAHQHADATPDALARRPDVTALVGIHGDRTVYAACVAACAERDAGRQRPRAGRSQGPELFDAGGAA